VSVSSPHRIVSLVNRAYGRAPSFSTTDVGTFKRAVELSDEELIKIATSGGVVIDMPVPREARAQHGRDTLDKPQ
jgi:hypothetical protein